MRERIAEIILVKGKPDDYGSALDRADQILSLFRQRIEQMQVLSPEQIEYWRFQACVSRGYGASDWAVDNLAKKIAQAQLAQDKEQLLGGMECSRYCA